jgi:hypothetical protein
MGGLVRVWGRYREAHGPAGRVRGHAGVGGQVGARARVSRITRTQKPVEAYGWRGFHGGVCHVVCPHVRGWWSGLAVWAGDLLLSVGGQQGQKLCFFTWSRV